MLAMPAPTPYDLNFRLLGIPVRVHPFFWLVTALMGYSERPVLTLVWVACVFVSILVHEFGHGLMGRAFGSHPRIALYGMGGLCSSEGEGTLGRRLAVILAGPGAGFLLFGLVFAVATIAPPRTEIAADVVGNLILINLAWGVINLLPLWPMDGGQALGAILTRVNPWRGMHRTHVVGLVVGVLAALFFLRMGQQYPAFLFAYFAYGNFQGMQATQGGGWGGGGGYDDRWRG